MKYLRYNAENMITDYIKNSLTYYTHKKCIPIFQNFVKKMGTVVKFNVNTHRLYAEYNKFKNIFKI